MRSTKTGEKCLQIREYITRDGFGEGKTVIVFKNMGSLKKKTKKNMGSEFKQTWIQSSTNYY